MPEGKPALLFRGVPVVVLFNAAIPAADRRSVMLAIAGFLEELVITDAGLDALIAGVPPLVDEYGFVARLTQGSLQRIGFTVTRQQGHDARPPSAIAG